MVKCQQVWPMKEQEKLSILPRFQPGSLGTVVPFIKMESWERRAVLKEKGPEKTPENQALKSRGNRACAGSWSPTFLTTSCSSCIVGSRGGGRGGMVVLLLFSR